MTSTDRLVAGVMGALFAPPARLYEKNAAFGVTIVCAAFTTQMEVMITTTVAIRMTPGRENFWTRIVIAFILFGFLCVGFPMCWLRVVYQTSVTLPAIVPVLPLWIRIVSGLFTSMSTLWVESMYTTWVPPPLPIPDVIAAPNHDSKPTHSMKVPGACNKLT